jgi:hypothetical protein
MIFLTRFEAAQRTHHLRRANLLDRKLAEIILAKSNEPFVFFDRPEGKPLPPALLKPFLGERGKIVIRGQTCRFFDRDGVPALRQGLSGLQEPLSCIGKANFGEFPQTQRLTLALETVVEAPQARSLLGNENVEPLAPQPPIGLALGLRSNGLV